LRMPPIALSLAALGFLGLGPQPPDPDWGLVLAEGLPYVERAPLVVLVPTGALLLLSILAVSLSSLSLDRRGRRWRKQKNTVTSNVKHPTTQPISEIQPHTKRSEI